MLRSERHGFVDDMRSRQPRWIECRSTWPAMRRDREIKALEAAGGWIPSEPSSPAFGIDEHGTGSCQRTAIAGWDAVGKRGSLPPPLTIMQARLEKDQSGDGHKPNGRTVPWH